MLIPKHLEKVRDITITKEELIEFESVIAEQYNNGSIKAAIHLAKNNENELIELFQYIHPDDWVFVAWRNHYHALLHGMAKEDLFRDIIAGRSMSTSFENFYASSIVGGIIPIAVGTALAVNLGGSGRRVWCFVGDMTFETGIFHEAYKYANNFELPIQWVIEDNEMSVHTPTRCAWGGEQRVPDDIIYYSYDMEYPHHGTGKYVNF